MEIDSKIKNSSESIKTQIENSTDFVDPKQALGQQNQLNFQFMTTLLHRFNKLDVIMKFYNNPVLTDIVLKVGNDSIRCHKLVIFYIT